MSEEDADMSDETIEAAKDGQPTPDETASDKPTPDDVPGTEEPTVAPHMMEVVQARPTGFYPRNMQDLTQLAAAFIKAGMVPESYIVANPPKSDKIDWKATQSRLMVGILKGLELGVGPVTAIQWIYLVKGRPTAYGDLCVALVHRSGQVVKWEEWFAGSPDEEGREYGMPGYVLGDDFTAHCRIARKGHEEPYGGEFSLGQARKIGLSKKPGPWQDYTKRQLMWRARTYAMRDGFADALGGLAIREEIEDLAEEPRQIRVDDSFLDG